MKRAFAALPSIGFGGARRSLSRSRRGIGSRLWMFAAVPGVAVGARAQSAHQGLISLPTAQTIVVPAPVAPAPQLAPAVIPASTPATTGAAPRRAVSGSRAVLSSSTRPLSKTIIAAHGIKMAPVRQNFATTLGASTPVLDARLAPSPHPNSIAKPSDSLVREKLVALDESLRAASSTNTSRPVASKTASTNAPAPAKRPQLVALPPKLAPLPVFPRTDSPQASSTKPNSALAATARPSRLASREAAARGLLLARLDAQLAREQGRLRHAETRLAKQQRQLGAFTDVIRSAMLEDKGDGRGLHPFVRVAQRYKGVPYVWGGESARGFDCSGFIIRVMRDLGYKALPHSAAEQFNYGMPVANALLKPGDLVFFANTYKPGVSHVGIYLGRRRFIHAAGTGQGTIVSSLDAAKFRAKYAGARRLIAQ